jgi:hypothetical protein
MKMAVLVLCFCLGAFPLRAASPASMQQDLQEIARVASVMVDGDTCQHIVTPRAMEHMLHPDPRDEWSGGDNYDVNDANFIRVKKTLMRLALLAQYPVDVNLWMPMPTKQPRIQVVIRNHYNLSQFWGGELDQAMPPEMQTVLETGKTLTVQKKPEMISVLAPVRNSLGQIVGLVEVVGSTASPLHDEQ